MKVPPAPVSAGPASSAYAATLASSMISRYSLIQ